MVRVAYLAFPRRRERLNCCAYLFSRSSTNQAPRLQEARTDPKVHPTASLADPQVASSLLSTLLASTLSLTLQQPTPPLGIPSLTHSAGRARLFVPFTHCHRGCVPFGQPHSVPSDNDSHRVLLICRVNRNNGPVLRVKWIPSSVRSSIDMQHPFAVELKHSLASRRAPSGIFFFDRH